MLLVIALAFGLALWVAFLLAMLVLSGIVWAVCNLCLGIAYLVELPGRKKRKAAGTTGAPAKVQRRAPALAPARAAQPARERPQPPSQNRRQRPAQALAASEIWPKWTPARRRSVDEELTLWQEQFDALSSHRQAPLRID